MPVVTCIADSQDSLGEACLWDAASQCLWWLDIARPSRIHRLVVATGEHRMWHSTLLLTALVRRARGGFLLAGEDGLYAFDPETGVIRAFAFPQPENSGNRFNDGACDALGRFFVGTMMQNIGPRGEDIPITAETGALYRVGAKGRSVCLLSGIGVFNEPCWSPDGTIFYFSDSSRQLMFACDFDAATGEIANRRLFNDNTSYGYPDGAAVDAEGFIWSARWDGSCVLRIDPKGRIDRVVPMPATRPTSVCFGGPKLDIMYVTSSRAHMGSDVLTQFPLQGGIFCFDPGVTGFEKHHFAG